MAKTRTTPTPMERRFGDLLGFVHNLPRFCKRRGLPLRRIFWRFSEEMRAELRLLAGDHVNGFVYAPLTSRAYTGLVRGWISGARRRTGQGDLPPVAKRLLGRAAKRGTVTRTLRHWAARGWIARGVWQPLDDDTRRWLQGDVHTQDADLRPYFFHSWVRLRRPKGWARLPATVQTALERVIRQYDQRLTVTWSLCPACPEGEERFVPRWGNTTACLRCRRNYGTEKRLWSAIRRTELQRQQLLEERTQRAIGTMLRRWALKRITATPSDRAWLDSRSLWREGVNVEKTWAALRKQRRKELRRIATLMIGETTRTWRSSGEDPG